MCKGGRVSSLPYFHALFMLIRSQSRIAADPTNLQTPHRSLNNVAKFSSTLAADSLSSGAGGKELVVLRQAVTSRSRASRVAVVAQCRDVNVRVQDLGPCTKLAPAE